MKAWRMNWLNGLTDVNKRFEKNNINSTIHAGIPDVLYGMNIFKEIT
jgi:hypothetical protein